MKLARVFLNPNGEQWCDFPIPENVVLPQIWSQVMIEGAFYSPSAIVPIKQVHHVMLVEIAVGAPAFTTISSGKPN